MTGSISHHRLAVLTLLLSSLSVGCQQKARIQAQTDEYAAKIAELSPVLQKLDAEMAALDLYNAQSPERRLSELTAQVDLLKSETARLSSRCDETKESLAQAQKELDDYREKYGRK